MELKGKTFVVTGGGSGLGRQLTLELVKDGANVACKVRNLLYHQQDGCRRKICNYDFFRNA